MRRPRLSLLLLGLITVSGVHSSRAWAQGTPVSAQQDRTRTLFRQAATAFSAGKSDEARKLLLEAWNIRRTYDVAAALGQAELDLKLYRDAAEHLAYAVENFVPAESAQSLEELKRDLRTAKAHVAEVRVNVVNGAGADVFANNIKLGAAPLAANVFLDPGSYRLEARRDAQPIARSERKFDENGSYTVDLVVPASAANSVSSGLSTSPEAPNSTTTDRPNWTPTLVTGGLALVALGIGTGFAIDASSARSDMDDKLKEAQATFGESNPCAPGRGMDSGLCSDLRNLDDRRGHSRTAATVSFVAGGVFAAAAVGTYFLWADKPAALKSSASLAASVGDGGARLLFQGSF
jgi:hypothetical protein